MFQFLNFVLFNCFSWEAHLFYRPPRAPCLSVLARRRVAEIRAQRRFSGFPIDRWSKPLLPGGVNRSSALANEKLTLPEGRSVGQTEASPSWHANRRSSLAGKGGFESENKNFKEWNANFFFWAPALKGKWIFCASVLPKFNSEDLNSITLQRSVSLKTNFVFQRSLERGRSKIFSTFRYFQTAWSFWLIAEHSNRWRCQVRTWIRPNTAGTWFFSLLGFPFRTKYLLIVEKRQ